MAQTHNHTTPTADTVPAFRTHAMAAAAILVAVTAAFSLQFHSYSHVKELVLCAALLPLALMRRRRGPLAPQDFAPFAPIGFAVLCGLLGGIFAGTPWAIMVPECLRLTVIILAAILIRDLTSNDQTWAILRMGILPAALLVSLLALLQRFELDGGLFPIFPHYDQPMYSVFGNQDALGGFLVLALPLAVGLLLKANADSGRLRMGLASGALLMLSVTLALTECRSAWIAAFAGIAVCFIPARGHEAGQSRRWLWLLPLPAVLLLAAALSPKVSASFAAADTGIWSRLWFWEGAVSMILHHMALGAGPGGFAYWSPSHLGGVLNSGLGFTHFHNEIHTLHAHNDLLEFLATSGFAGAALAAWCLTRLDYRGAAARDAWAVLAGAGVFALFYPLWSSPAHLLVVLLCWSRVVRSGASPVPASRISPIAGWRGPALALIAAAAYIAAVVSPSYALTRAEAAHLRRDAPSAVESLYWSAIKYAPFPHEIWKSYGVFLYEQGRFAEAVDAFERASKGLDTGEIYWLKSVAMDAAGDPGGAADSCLEVLARWPWHVQARELLNSMAQPEPGFVETAPH